MKLTPLDIRHKEFRRSMRGYSDEEVDVFLDEVADEFERLFQENIDAQDRIQRLEQQVAQYEQLKETLQATLISAQQQADEVRANARKEAELILKDSELKGRDLVGEAYTEKQRVQQSLIQLRQVEEDFRFKFRSLLEAHLNLLAEDEVSEERGQFRGLVASVEQELEQTPSGRPTGGLPGAGTRDDVTPDPPPSEPIMAPVVKEAVVDTRGVPIVDAPPVIPPADDLDLDRFALPDEASPQEPVDDDAPYDRSDVETQPESAVKRFLFGRREREEVAVGEDSEDREFRW